MSSVSHQTLAVGQPLHSSPRWGALGGFSDRMIASPEGVFAFIVGAPGSGKSALMQTCPDAFIFNLDPTSTTVPGEPGGPAPQPQALMWPGMSPEGFTLNDAGVPFVLAWSDVEAKCEILFRLFREKAPRPKIVCFDSLSRMIALLKEHLPANAASLNLAKENKSSWKELDGRARWDLLYDKIVDLCVKLPAHGYGVYVIGHLVNSVIQLGEAQNIIKPELTITDTFWKRLYPYFEIVLVAQAFQEAVSIPDPAWRPNPAFPREKPRTIAVTRRRVYLTTGGPELSGITKVRVPISTVLLEPASSAWSVFLAAYNEAASRGTLEAKEIVPPSSSK